MNNNYIVWNPLLKQRKHNISSKKQNFQFEYFYIVGFHPYDVCKGKNIVRPRV